MVILGECQFGQLYHPAVWAILDLCSVELACDGLIRILCFVPPELYHIFVIRGTHVYRKHVICYVRVALFDLIEESVFHSRWAQRDGPVRERWLGVFDFHPA